jgi:hypothetical protein
MSTKQPTALRDDEVETEPGSRTMGARPSTDGTAANFLTVRRFSGVINDILDEPTVSRDSSWELTATEFWAEDVSDQFPQFGCHRKSPLTAEPNWELPPYRLAALVVVDIRRVVVAVLHAAAFTAHRILLLHQCHL